MVEHLLGIPISFILPSVNLRSQNLGGGRLETNKNKIIGKYDILTRIIVQKASIRLNSRVASAFIPIIQKSKLRERELLCQVSWSEEAIKKRISQHPTVFTPHTFSFLLFEFNATCIQRFMASSQEMMTFYSWIFYF